MFTFKSFSLVFLSEHHHIELLVLQKKKMYFCIIAKISIKFSKVILENKMNVYFESL